MRCFSTHARKNQWNLRVRNNHLVRSVLWALKGSVKMEGRIVDELDPDICRLVLIAYLVNTAD